MPALSSSPRARTVLETNLWSMWSQFGRAPGSTLHQSDGALWFETPIPIPPYNMVVRFHGGTDAGAAIAAIFAHFRQRGVPFVWLVHPSATPADLTERLRARGFEEVEPIAGMAAGLGELLPPPPAPQGVEIHCVTPEHDFQPFMEFVASRWQVPNEARTALSAIGAAFKIGAPGSPNRAWLAVKDGVAIAKAATHDSTDETGRVVGLYGMATKPEARGLGLGRLLCLTALADAKARGHDLAILHATPMAVSLYRSLGFRNLAQMHVYAAPNSFYA